jgi:hypothetical protein
VVSVGVKVTLSDGVPAPGVVAGAVQAKPPDTEAVPPANVEEVNVCPKVMALAAGHADTVGDVELFDVTLTCPATVL